MGCWEHCPHSGSRGLALGHQAACLAVPDSPMGVSPLTGWQVGTKHLLPPPPAPSPQLLSPGVPRCPPAPTKPQPPQRDAHKPLSHLCSPRPDLSVPLAEPPHLVSPSPKPPATSGIPPHATSSCPGPRASEDSCMPHPGALACWGGPCPPCQPHSPQGRTRSHFRPPAATADPHPPSASVVSHVIPSTPQPFWIILDTLTSGGTSSAKPLRHGFVPLRGQAPCPVPPRTPNRPSSQRTAQARSPVRLHTVPSTWAPILALVPPAVWPRSHFPNDSTKVRAPRVHTQLVAARGRRCGTCTARQPTARVDLVPTATVSWQDTDAGRLGEARKARELCLPGPGHFWGPGQKPPSNP